MNELMLQEYIHCPSIFNKRSKCWNAGVVCGW